MLMKAARFAPGGFFCAALSGCSRCGIGVMKTETAARGPPLFATR